MKKELKQILVVFALIIALVTVCALVTGCGEDPNGQNPIFTLKTTDTTASSTETSATTPVATGNVNPLTGLYVTKDFSNQRPVAIVVDNIGNALTNQTGLGQADILYEGLVAPGITRFLAVIEDYESISPICNIRSGRDYHIYSAFNHNAILVSHGGSITKTPSGTLFFNLAEQLLDYTVISSKVYYGFINTIQEKQFTQIESGIRLGTIHFYSGKDYSKIYSNAETLAKVRAVASYPGRNDLNWDTLVTSTSLIEVLSSGYVLNVPGFSKNGAPTESLKFVAPGYKADMSEGNPATNVVFKFSVTGETSAKYVEYTYRNDKYFRSMNGTAHVDSLTGEQLNYTNLIALKVPNASYIGTEEDRKLVDVTVVGSGTGSYITGGKEISIRWSKESVTSPLVLRDESGEEIKLTPGNTCISFLNSYDADAVIVK